MSISISGNNFADTDGNGQRGTSLLKGENPDVVVILDNSGSTLDQFIGTEAIADMNFDGNENTILDSEISAASAFHNFLIEGGYSSSKLALISFNDAANIIFSGNAGDSTDDRYNFKQQLNTLQIGGGTNYDAPLQVAKSLLDKWQSETGNIVFLSDGYPNFGLFNPEIAQGIQADGHNIQAFGAGMGASKLDLDSVDSDGKSYLFYTPDELVQVFSGELSEDVQREEAVVYLEDGMEGNTIFIDLNNNGFLDDGEPSAVTDSFGNYKMDADLKSGKFNIQTLDSSGMIIEGGGVDILISDESDYNVNIGSQIDGGSNNAITSSVEGRDVLIGVNNVADDFVIQGDGGDIIKKFNPSEDTISLDSDLMGGLNSPDLHVITKKKQLRRHRDKRASELIYYQPKGKLFLDANQSESGWGEGGLIAKLKGSPELTSEIVNIA